MKVAYTFCLVLGLFSSRAFATEHESMARDALTRLSERYRLYKVQATDEINLICMGEIFTQWYKGYESALSSTQLRMDQIPPWADASKLAVGHNGDIKLIYSLFRPQIVTATRQVMSEYRQAGHLPTPPVVQLDKVHMEIFEASLVVCTQPTYHEAVARLAPPAQDLDANRQVIAQQVILNPLYLPSSSSNYVGLAMTMTTPAQVALQVQATQVKLSMSEHLLEIRVR